MRLGICSISLPELTPEQAVPVARDAGYAGIEWRVTPERERGADRGARPSFFSNNLCSLAPTKDAVARAVELTESAGLRVVGLDTYVDAGDLAGAENALDLAASGGAPWIRVRAPWRDGRPYAELRFQARGFLRRLASLARTYQVQALLEIHQGTICPSASLAHRLVSEFDPHWIGVVYDAGNLPNEDHGHGLDVLGEHLAHVHLKNAAFVRPCGGGVWSPEWSALGDGVVDVRGLFAALRERGYDGWVGVEDFRARRSSADIARCDAEFLRRLLE
jgi:sugar phosphate isomerase/epimerase